MNRFRSINCKFIDKMEKKKILPFVGENSLDPKLSVLVVSAPEFCLNLCEALEHCKIENSSLKIEIHQVPSIESFLSSFVCRLHFDFIVFAVDTRLASALESLSNNIYHIDKHYIAMSRVCIVGSHEIPIQEKNIDHEDVLEFANQFQCPVLWGYILDKRQCSQVAQRIINLAATVTGARTGLPFVVSTNLTHISKKLSGSYATATTFL